MQQRQMNEFELADAKSVLNWQYWGPPLALTLLCLGMLAGFWNEEPSAKSFLACSSGRLHLFPGSSFFATSSASNAM